MRCADREVEHERAIGILAQRREVVDHEEGRPGAPSRKGLQVRGIEVIAVRNDPGAGAFARKSRHLLSGAGLLDRYAGLAEQSSCGSIKRPAKNRRDPSLRERFSQGQAAADVP